MSDNFWAEKLIIQPTYSLSRNRKSGLFHQFQRFLEINMIFFTNFNSIKNHQEPTNKTIKIPSKTIRNFQRPSQPTKDPWIFRRKLVSPPWKALQGVVRGLRSPSRAHPGTLRRPTKIPSAKGGKGGRGSSS